jgi:T4 superinfection immunity protein
MGAMLSIWFSLSLLIVGFCFYFLPTFVAYFSKHLNLGAVFALNFLLGWTVIGWVAALVWAMMRTQHRQPPTN